MGVVTLSVEPSEPLVKAALEDDLGAARRLLAGGADANVIDEETGTSALAEAVSNGNREMVVKLLRAGARANARNKLGRTPLMHAAVKGHGDNVRALVSAGAELDRRDEDGSTALALARDDGQPETADLLVAYGAADDGPRETPAEAAPQP